MHKGFFASMILLAFAALFLQMNRLEISQNADLERAALVSAQIEDASFARAEAETYIDAAISNAVTASLVPPVEAEKTKRSVDSAIVSSFKKLGIEAYVCPINRNSGRRHEPLTEESMGQLSKAIAAKMPEGTIITYIVTGGESKGKKICGTIKRGKYSSRIELPLGYNYIAVVPWQ